MRFKEFGPKQDKQLDEILPALMGAARVIGAAGTLYKGAQAVGNAVSKGVQAAGNVASKGAQALGKMTDAGKTLMRQQQQRDMINTLKVGNTISHPKLGDVKIKAVKGNNIELDTKNSFGQDVSVNKDDLVSVINPNTAQDKNPLASKSIGGTSQNVGGIAKGI